MLDGIKEKMAMLIDDIEKEVGKDSKLYVHAYDVYADLILLKMETFFVIEKDAILKEAFKSVPGNVVKGSDLTDEVFGKRK